MNTTYEIQLTEPIKYEGTEITSVTVKKSRVNTGAIIRVAEKMKAKLNFEELLQDTVFNLLLACHATGMQPKAFEMLNLADSMAVVKATAAYISGRDPAANDEDEKEVEDADGGTEDETAAPLEETD